MPGQVSLADLLSEFQAQPAGFGFVPRRRDVAGNASATLWSGIGVEVWEERKVVSMQGLLGKADLAPEICSKGLFKIQ